MKHVKFFMLFFVALPIASGLFTGVVMYLWMTFLMTAFP